jgi:hypothetical protein
MSTNWQDNDQDVELLHHVVAFYHKWRALAFVVGLTTLLTATALYMVAGAMQGYRAGRQGQIEPCLARPHEPLHQRMQREVACEVRRRGAKRVSVVGAVP